MQVMGEKADTLGLAAFETLPWACRFNDWGKTATVLGTKAPRRMRARERESGRGTSRRAKIHVPPRARVRKEVTGCV